MALRMTRSLRTPIWRESEELLKSVPGVGNVVARTLIAELPELGTLERRKIAAPTGDEFVKQSGDRDDDRRRQPSPPDRQ